MAFWSKPQKNDIEAVKQAVVPQEKPQEPPLPKVELGKLPERPRFAPLFVKIERYQEVLSNIENLKTILLGTRELLGLMQQINKIKIEADVLLQKRIQEIVLSISNLDKEFIRPRGVEIREQPIPRIESEKLESYIGELQRELDNLRSQLQTIRTPE